MLRLLFAFVVIAASAGCLRSTTFQCSENTECGSDGQCTQGFCSFADSSCAGMGDRRWGENSGPNSGQCIGSVTPPEGGGNEMTGGEMQVGQCPGNYDVLPDSGTRGHRYRLITQNRTWAQHRDDCQAAGVSAGKTIFLAFPDGPEAAMELAALRTLAGDNAWVGVEKLTGPIKNALGVMVSAETQALIMPVQGPGDCYGINGTSLDDRGCTDTRRAVCECVP